MKVLFEKKGPIAYVTINRPERLNACDFETYGMLTDIWCEFRDDAALRVAIMTGTGDRAFCAGSGPSRIPSEPTPKLRWQMILTCSVVNGAGRFLGSMTM